ncbi:uncharacterized protein FIBRA_03450 [Fibroporia radiculosa]|uniref:Mixed lineage kinase domain-containing protein n=1 Tax=Fibroporia radiculosa TaxID=599839 RepID=J4H2E8_9APHY|nr:uncharacterized protein FIBRA_03450 [Fibroporia radiculosa]CCM01399.1 predicted protein [Fibroporia radiculosa]
MNALDDKLDDLLSTSNAAMPFPLSFRRVQSDEIFDGVTITLEAIQDASSTLGVFPFLGIIATAALGIVRTLQKVSDDRERSIRLAQRAADLVQHVQQAVSQDPEAIGVVLSENLTRLYTTLASIQSNLEKDLDQRSLVRFLRNSKMSKKLDGHIEALDRAWKVFDTMSLIAIQQTLENQAHRSRRASSTHERPGTLDSSRECVTPPISSSSNSAMLSQISSSLSSHFTFLVV